MKRTLAAYGVSFAVFEVNQTSAMKRIQAVLKEKSGFSTVPNLFIRGESKGGCMDVKALKNTGQLATLLAPFVGKERNKGPEMSSLGLLWFPDTANGHVVRLVGLFTMIYSILCVIFYRSYPTRWAVLALALDFLARLVYGASHSLMGALASALVVNLPPKWSAGPPKQFAALCGVFFSTFGAGLFLGGQRVGGAIVIALLAGAAGCEGIFDFCFGCWMFGLAISFGILPASVYQPYLNMVSDRKWGYVYMNEKRTFPVAVNEHYLLPGQNEPSKVDLVRKDRLELEYKLQDVNLIRHTKIDFFAIPMAIGALAYMFKLTDNTHDLTDFNGGYAYQVLALFSVITAGLIAVFYGLRLLLHPQKIWKEWSHPSQGNYFSAITICITLYGLLLLPKSVNGGGALIWIGSIGQMLITVFRVSDLVYSPVSDEWLNPSVMMAPVGNYICTIGFTTFGLLYNGPNLRGDVNYLYLSRLWFAIATLFAIVFFTLTFRRSFSDHYSDNRNRPTLYVWLATASIAGPAYVACSNDVMAGQVVFFQSCWFIALFFFTILGLGWLKNFFNYDTKDLSMWIVPFAYSAFAISTITYQTESSAPSELFTTLCIITGVIACASMAVCGAHTLSMIFDLSLWTPRQKWGPVSFMKLTHEALRVGIPKINTILNGMDPNTINPVAIDNLLTELDGFFTTYAEHGRHEDDVLFPKVRRYFPNLNPKMNEEHEYEHRVLDEMLNEIQNYRQVHASSSEEGKIEVGDDSTDAAKLLLNFLRTTFPGFGDHLQAHLRNEENTVTVAMRKYVPIDYQREITKEVFDMTSGKAWSVVMPWVIEHLPVPAWKARYVKTFVWANPMRAQEIGLILYPRIDSVTWAFLSREIPEIIPRGLSGYKRYY